MADILSISASIAGLLSITEIIIRNGYNFIRACKEAEEAVLRLINEVNSLAGILYSLGNIVQRFEDDNTAIEPATQIHHIESCYQTLRKVEAVLEKANPAKSSGGLSTAIRKLCWPMTKSETKELITEVARYQTTLSLALSADGMYVIIENPCFSTWSKPSIANCLGLHCLSC
jgi:hypothetical protein